MKHADVSAATEKWFVKRGIPHFIENYSASQDVLTRSLPILTLVFLLEMLNAVNLDDEWTLLSNLGAVLGAVVIATSAFILTNVARKRRPMQRFDDVGIVEIAIFVLVPPMLPVIFGTQVGSAFATIVFNSALLGIIYLSTSYGVVPMTRWALGRTVRNLKDVYALFVRAMPLLLLFVTFLFLTTEVWQAAASMSAIAFSASLFLFVGIGVAFALFKLPEQLNDLTSSSELTHEKIVQLCQNTPVDEESRVLTSSTIEPLRKRQWLNMGLLLLFSEGVQIVLVTFFIFAFLFVLSALTTTSDVVQVWVGTKSEVIANLDWLGDNAVITQEALLVCGFLATFSGLYFTVYLLTDANYRAEFLEDMLDQLRQNLAVRAVYQALVERSKA